MSARQYIVDASTRHQVFLQRYAGGQSKEAIRTLNRMRRDIMARLSGEPTEFQRARLTAVLRDIEDIYSAGFGEIKGRALKGAYDLAANEAEFSTELYNKASSANFVLPADAVLIQAVDNSLMAAPKGSVGISIQSALDQYGAKKAEQIAQAIRDGLALGDSTPDISKSVNYLMRNLQRNQLDTLVRTIANHTSSIAREAVYNQNSDVLDGYEWVATLDNRTTLICGSRDGKKYEVGIGPMPPAHWGCRSTTIPTVSPEFSLAKGLKYKRPAIGADGVEHIGSNSTYGGWLRKQPTEFIDEALGVERSRLFRSGKLSIDKFVDPTGRVYTLEQLRQMNPFAFQEI